MPMSITLAISSVRQIHRLRESRRTNYLHNSVYYTCDITVQVQEFGGDENTGVGMCLGVITGRYHWTGWGAI